MALVVLVLLGGMLWGVFRFFTKAGKSEVERLDARAELALALGRLREELAAANPLVSFDAATGALNPVLRPPLVVSGAGEMRYRVFPPEQRLPGPPPGLEDLRRCRGEQRRILREGEELVMIRSAAEGESRRVLGRGLESFRVEILPTGSEDRGMIRLELALRREGRPPVTGQETVVLNVPVRKLSGGGTFGGERP